MDKSIEYIRSSTEKGYFYITKKIIIHVAFACAINLSVQILRSIKTEAFYS